MRLKDTHDYGKYEKHLDLFELKYCANYLSNL